MSVAEVDVSIRVHRPAAGALPLEGGPPGSPRVVFNLHALGPYRESEDGWRHRSCMSISVVVGGRELGDIVGHVGITPDGDAQVGTISACGHLEPGPTAEPKAKIDSPPCLLVYSSQDHLASMLHLEGWLRVTPRARGRRTELCLRGVIGREARDPLPFEFVLPPVTASVVTEE